MNRHYNAAAKPIFHTPMLMNWTEEKLLALDQDQLLNLLSNLDEQRAIGRLNSTVAAPLEQRITALLNTKNAAKRRRQIEAGADGTGDAQV